MSVPVIAFFNNKGGVGKTSLVYHVAHMLANLDFRVVATDLDPQANLSAAFLDDEQLELLKVKFLQENPKTKEDLLFCFYYEKYYGNNLWIPYRWLPKWVKCDDPSARELSVYVLNQNREPSVL